MYGAGVRTARRMTTELERTCWRGMQIGHPADWELSLASALDAPGQCSFSDRYYQRLDVRWRPVTYVPDMDRMLDKYRTRKGKKTAFHDAGHLPDAWRGLACKIEGATSRRSSRSCPRCRRRTRVRRRRRGGQAASTRPSAATGNSSPASRRWGGSRGSFVRGRRPGTRGGRCLPSSESPRRHTGWTNRLGTGLRNSCPRDRGQLTVARRSSTPIPPSG